MSTSESAGTEQDGEAMPRPTGGGPATGDTGSAAEPAAADAADASGLSVLDELDGRPLHEHVAVYDELHARLQSALNRIDEA